MKSFREIQTDSHPRPPWPGGARILRSKSSRESDLDAFDHLIREHQRRILTIAYQMCGNIEDARDIAQDTFLRAFRYRRRMRRGRLPGPWLNRIAVNSALDFLRKRRGAETIPLEEADLPTGQGWNPHLSTPIEEHIQHREQEERLFSLLDRLAPRERAAFVLRHLHGLSTEETARSMGCTRITVRRHTSRARVKLRAAFQTGPGAEPVGQGRNPGRPASGGRRTVPRQRKNRPAVERSRAYLGSNK